MAKEQTNGGSKLNIVIGEFITNKEKEIKMPPEKAKKLTIATIENMKKIEQEGYLEINVGYHEAFKEGDKIVKRLVDGKEITDNKKAKTSRKSSNKNLETR